MVRSFGSWVFLIGVVLAVILGAIGQLTPLMTAILVVIGLVVGILNVTEKETKPFLMAGTVLVIMAFFGKEVMSAIPILGYMLDAIMAMVVPATVLVALKSVFELARK